MQPADVAGPHLRLQAVPRFRRDAFRHAAPLRRRQQPRQAAFAIALPPALNGAHTIVQDLRGLTDARPSLRNRSIRTRSVLVLSRAALSAACNCAISSWINSG